MSESEKINNDADPRHLLISNRANKGLLKYDFNNRAYQPRNGMPLLTQYRYKQRISSATPIYYKNSESTNNHNQNMINPMVIPEDVDASKSIKNRTNPYSRPISAQEIIPSRSTSSTNKSSMSEATRYVPQINNNETIANRPNIFLQPTTELQLSNVLKQPISFSVPLNKKIRTSNSNPMIAIEFTPMPATIPTNKIVSPQQPSKISTLVNGKQLDKENDIEEKLPLQQPISNGRLISKSPYKLVEEQTAMVYRQKKIEENVSRPTVQRARQSLMTLFGENSQVAKTAEKLLEEMSKNKINKINDPPVIQQKSNKNAIMHLHSNSNSSRLPPTPPNNSNPKTGITLTNRVRNLNYTPTKPYYEVSEKEDTVIDLHHTNESGDKQKDTITLSENKNVYYRKSSKAEEVLIKHRPKTTTDIERSSSLSTNLLNKETMVFRNRNKQQTPNKPKTATSKLEKIENISKQEDYDEEDDVDVDDGAEEDDDVDDDDGILNTLADDDDLADDYDDEDNENEDEEDENDKEVISKLRLKSSTKKLLGCKSVSRPQTAHSSDSNISLQPALTASFFSNVPPTINFVSEGEKVETLPWSIRKYFKWRMSTITPNVVKYAIFRSHFRPTKKDHDWLGYWGKHMKAPAFRAVRYYQKVNHFPGSFQIGRKDRLWKNLSRLLLIHGKREFGFFPQTYVLPGDLKQLKRAWEEGGARHKWILKPPASARGIGIRVVHKWNQIPKKRPVIVQRYLSRPFLINDSKFDLRIYVYVSSFDPLRIYVYEDGLTRFASRKYSYALKNLADKFMHLTNYSINKKNCEYTPNTDEKQCQGHKWSLKGLWTYLRKKGIQVNPIWEAIKDLIIKTIISCESSVNILLKSHVKSKYSCHELFGFDVMLDENLKPWIIEVNISPSLHSNSPLDISVKGEMVKDVLNLSGYLLPDKIDANGAVIGSDSTIGLVDGNNNNGPQKSTHLPKKIVLNRRFWMYSLSTDERTKHAYYCQRSNDDNFQSTIFDTLTPSDIRILMETIDENERRGNFERVFPHENSSKYLRYFETPRYNNLLLDAWMKKYAKNPGQSISVLESLAEEKIHLQMPGSDNPNHQWNPPTRVIGSTRVSSHLPPISNTNLSSVATQSARSII